jgi:hypothetical protein
MGIDVIHGQLFHVSLDLERRRAQDPSEHRRRIPASAKAKVRRIEPARVSSSRMRIPETPPFDRLPFDRTCQPGPSPYAAAEWEQV